MRRLSETVAFKLKHNSRRSFLEKEIDVGLEVGFVPNLSKFDGALIALPIMGSANDNPLLSRARVPSEETLHDWGDSTRVDIVLLTVRSGKPGD